MTATTEIGRWYPNLPPQLQDESIAEYTDRLTGADGTDRVPFDHPRNRQCSIGWHGECSDPAGEECKCPCHRLAAALLADGYGEPLVPMPGTSWVDKDASWLPEGQRRVVWLTSVGKTVTGWQVRLNSFLLDADGKTVDGPREGLIYLDYLLDNYAPEGS